LQPYSLRGQKIEYVAMWTWIVLVSFAISASPRSF
jgi:hypothetical protein